MTKSNWKEARGLGPEEVIVTAIEIALFEAEKAGEISLAVVEGLTRRFDELHAAFRDGKGIVINEERTKYDIIDPPEGFVRPSKPETNKPASSDVLVIKHK